ncbi:NudC domain-containing protein 3 [Paragonimus heterotremus]|uniref:NudC domain-containing protein 3 n=1 Tax=Paragonimus heterotremus TaxID=100268 RepID=A0A8J4WST9_9TREM|nr:NudC domain-containing protein 3 [Paragonimus heterotremus]
MEAKYDSALLGILQHEGKIEKFLDVIFGFLMRRTDFYHIMTPDQKKLGFPPGVSLRMVVRAFERYKTMFENYEEQRREAANLATDNKTTSQSKDDDIPVNSSKEAQDTGQADVPAVSTLQVQSTESMKQEMSPNTDHDAEDSTPTVYQADPECYNGAVRDRYTWSQSIKDVDINIKVPSVVKTGKDLKVIVDRKRVRVLIKSDGIEQPYFDRSLCWDIVKDEAVWTLHPKESRVHLCLDKVQERWWEAAFEGEDKINTRKIDCSRPMHELDEEAQAKIHQLMYDEQRKRQGLPTSEQQKVHDMLAKAWDQEGSPFRGTPFDPSKVNIAPS